MTQYVYNGIIVLEKRGKLGLHEPVTLGDMVKCYDLTKETVQPRYACDKTFAGDSIYEVDKDTPAEKIHLSQIGEEMQVDIFTAGILNLPDNLHRIGFSVLELIAGFSQVPKIYSSSLLDICMAGAGLLVAYIGFKGIERVKGLEDVLVVEYCPSRNLMNFINRNKISFNPKTYRAKAKKIRTLFEDYRF